MPDVFEQLQELFERGLLDSSEHILVSRNTDGRFSLTFTPRVMAAFAVETLFAFDDFESYGAGTITSLDGGKSGTAVKWTDPGRFV